MSDIKDFEIVDSVLVKYHGNGGSVVVPDGVKRVGFSAFEECKTLTSITIPDSVTVIDSEAFRDCTNLARVNLPNSITTILYCAFRGCSSLVNIILPDSITYIDEGVFGDCTSLLLITLPKNISTISQWTFSHCTSLKFISIPNGVTSIEEGAFGYCASLVAITIPNGVVEIGDYAFTDCTNLTSIIIPNSVTHIGDYAFIDCKNFVVNTCKGSYAEKYAVEHEISVVYTRDKMKVMWYKKLVENEAAEYFMNNDICTDDEAEQEISMQMLKMYKRIVRDVTFSTSREMQFTVWQSIGSDRYAVDTELLTAEQCALLIMYPFWSRMGGSFEEHFYNSGRLKKYLCALKNKCDTK